MKKNLIEEIKRIQEITYKKENLNEEFFNDLLDKTKSTLGLKKVDDPKKADLVTTSPEDSYKTLYDAVKMGGLSQQKMGQMTYQKSVETLQIFLQLLGYSLPIYGVDGLYGPETSRAVEKFKQDNGLDISNKGANPEMLNVLASKVKESNLKPEEIKKYTDPVIPDDSGIKSNGNRVKYAIDFLVKNGNYTPEQASAIVGNLQVESGLNTNAVGDKNLSTPSFGIAQWRENRLYNLKKFARKNNKSINDLDTQLWFILHELKTTHRKVDRLLRRSNNLDYLAQVVQSKYEVSTPDSLPTRIKYTNQFNNMYNASDNQQFA